MNYYFNEEEKITVGRAQFFLVERNIVDVVEVLKIMGNLKNFHKNSNIMIINNVKLEWIRI